MKKALHKKRMTRAQFESFFAGIWQEKNDAGLRYRQNGQFKTAVAPGWKMVKGKGFAIRGRTWLEIARALKFTS